MRSSSPRRWHLGSDLCLTVWIQEGKMASSSVPNLEAHRGHLKMAVGSAPRSRSARRRTESVPPQRRSRLGLRRLRQDRKHQRRCQRARHPRPLARPSLFARPPLLARPVTCVPRHACIPHHSCVPLHLPIENEHGVEIKLRISVLRCIHETCSRRSLPSYPWEVHSLT